MSSIACAEVADRLPDWVAGRLSLREAAGVTEHVAGCEECARDATAIRTLLAGRPQAPADLAARMSAALRAEDALRGSRAPAPTRRPRGWVVSAAAVLVLAVGTYVLGGGEPTETAGLGQLPVDEGSVWMAEDGVVAGAPVLDDLSEDALATLLEEMGG